MNQRVFAAYIGEVPVLVIPSELMLANPILEDISDYAHDIGEVFYQLLPTDLWGKINQHKEASFELQVLQNDDALLTCPLDRDTAEKFAIEGYFLMITSSVDLDAEMLNGVEQPVSLESIEKWLRSKERENELPEGALDAVLVTVWDQKLLMNNSWLWKRALPQFPCVLQPSVT